MSDFNQVVVDRLLSLNNSRLNHYGALFSLGVFLLFALIATCAAHQRINTLEERAVQNADRIEHLRTRVMPHLASIEREPGT